MEDDYNWDEDDEGPSDGGEGTLVKEDADLPTIDSKSGRVINKPRQSGSPFMWLLGVKQSGFTPSGGAQQIVSKKNKKNKKFEAAEPEEEEYPEQEEYDEELTGDEDWDDDEEGGSRYAPINTKITITKVYILPPPKKISQSNLVCFRELVPEH
jgi:hypothetical protein